MPVLHHPGHDARPLSLEDGLDHLLTVVASLTSDGDACSVHGLCERNIAATVPDPGQDDIAPLAVRIN